MESNYYYILKGDFLQRTRSYAFLITMVVTAWCAYVFVPAPGANYTTLNVSGFNGVYNSAWVGHVSAMILSIVVFLFGFFLVNNSISKDIQTEVGLIVAGTGISNFEYLLLKGLSNFLVLLSISVVVFIGNILLCLWHVGIESLNALDFILPYTLIIIPMLCIVSSLAIVAEVFLRRFIAVQYIGWFFLFIVSLAYVMDSDASTKMFMLDIFGTKVIATSIEQHILEEFNSPRTGIVIGYTGAGDYKSFVWTGVDWNIFFVISRICWLAFSVGIIYVSSKFFHRFDVSPKEKVSKTKKQKQVVVTKGESKSRPTFTLPPIAYNYGIFPFIKTELRLMIRKGPMWLRIVTAGLMISLCFVNVSVAHQFLLPILWFLQVGRISDLTSKEKTNGVHYFAFASFKPLQRMLPSQLIAASCLLLALASPLLVRYLVSGELLLFVSILSGGVFIVSVSAMLGIVSNGKKLFEIIFFILTYALTQGAIDLDYVGAFPHESPMRFLAVFTSITFALLTVSFATRQHQLRNA